MSSLASATGKGPTIEIDGQTLSIQPRLVEHFGEVAAEILKLRGNPLDGIREIKDVFVDDPSVIDHFVRVAFEQTKKWKYVSLEEIGEYLESTWDGQVMGVWMAIRENDPNKWTHSYFRQQFSREFEKRLRSGGENAAAEWLSSIENVINEASDEGELGNSNGSSHQQESLEQETEATT